MVVSLHRYSRLNALDFSQEQKLDIVDEANEIFMLHLGILEELDRNAPPSSPRDPTPSPNSAKPRPTKGTFSSPTLTTPSSGALMRPIVRLARTHRIGDSRRGSRHGDAKVPPATRCGGG